MNLNIGVLEQIIAKEKSKLSNKNEIAMNNEIGIQESANDVHYINREDYLAHDVLLCINIKKKLEDEDRLRFNSNQFYFKTQDEMAQLFSEEYLKHTLEVGDKCDLTLDPSACHMPNFQTPDGTSPDEYLRKRIEEGVELRYGESFDDKRRERIIKEYEVIKKTGFSSYFLIIDDMIRYVKEKGILVGPGRGSAVASLVCYVLGITDVDPITNNLMFERFLTQDRVSPPDVDIDFQHDRREAVVDYLKNKYGYTAQIITFNRLSAKSLLRDVGKVLGLDTKAINDIAKRIPNNTDKTLAELQPEIPEMQNLDPRIINIGTKLVGH